VGVVFLFSSFTTRGITDIWGLYLKNYIHYTAEQIGIFTIGVGLAAGLGLGIIYPILIKFFGPITVLRLGLTNQVLTNIFVIIVSTQTQINGVYVFQVLNYMVLPLCNQLICMLAPQHEYGLALGSISGIGQFSSAAGPAIILALYSLFTSERVGILFPKAIFITGGVLAGIALSSSCFLPKSLNEKVPTIQILEDATTVSDGSGVGANEKDNVSAPLLQSGTEQTYASSISKMIEGDTNRNKENN